MRIVLEENIHCSQHPVYRSRSIVPFKDMLLPCYHQFLGYFPSAHPEHEILNGPLIL